MKDEILNSSLRFWDTSDFSDSNSSEAIAVFNELVKNNELYLVTPNLYWRGKPTQHGTTPPLPSQIIKKLYPMSGVGLSESSAANFLHLSQQVPNYIHVAVPTYVDNEIVGTIKFVPRPKNIGRYNCELNFPEVAILETLNSWNDYVEIPDEEGEQIIYELVNSERVNKRRLVASLYSEPQEVMDKLLDILNKKNTSNQ
jgi:hypothetical protein